MLEVWALSGGYGRKEIINNISFNLNTGEILCILGPNGCGKTTLFKLILGFLPKTKGEIIIEGQNIKEWNKQKLAHEVAYIPQAHTPAFDYRVIDMVLLGRSTHISPLSTPSKNDYNMAIKFLCLLNIKHLAEKQYTKISGGERQLVLIARALCQQAKILILDEPSANLDYANQQLVAGTITNLAQSNYTIILSTHSPEQPFQLAGKVLLMKNGRKIGFGAPKEILTSEKIKQVYGIDVEIVDIIDSANRRHSLCLSL